MVKRLVQSMLRKVGYDIVRYTGAEPFPVDLSEQDGAIIRSVRPYTMTSVERLMVLIDAVRHVVRGGFPGDIAECGVWRGGSMMAAAHVLTAEQDRSRHLYLFDTFEGMPEPSPLDRRFDGIPARDELDHTPRGEGVWCYAKQDEVRANMASTGYPADRIHLVRGKVEDTIPASAPARLALLRIDTDWYESTRHELEHLYPLLCPGGILIVDDYGHWQGARCATDEYFAKLPRRPFLHRIDSTGRVAVKC
jgi:hypothetical protein